MNKVWLLLLLAPMLFLGCSDNDDHPSLLEPLISPKLDFYFIVEHYSEFWDKDDDDLFITVVSKDPCGSLTINGVSFQRDSFNYNTMLGYYITEFNTDDEDWEILDLNNRVLSYQVNFPGYTRTGTIEAPASPELDFPDFNPDLNYELEWTIEDQPDFFRCDLTVGDIGDNYVSQSVERGSNALSITWYNDTWEVLTGTVDYWNADLTANNYNYEHNGLIWVMRTKERSDWGFGKAKTRQALERFEQLMRGEIRLPKKEY